MGLGVAGCSRLVGPNGEKDSTGERKGQEEETREEEKKKRRVAGGVVCDEATRTKTWMLGVSSAKAE